MLPRDTAVPFCTCLFFCIWLVFNLCRQVPWEVG